MALLPGTSQHWIQFGSALAGALAGAGAAFLANHYLQRRAEKRKDIAAGNTALATIGQMYIAFLKVRRMLHEEAQRRDDEMPGVPLWLAFKPPLHFLGEAPVFEYSGLAFLFEAKYASTYEHLFHLETNHRDLMGHLKHAREILVKKQDKAEGVKLFDAERVKRSVLESAVGRRLIIEIRGALETLDERVRELEGRYLEVGAELRHAMLVHFGADIAVVRVAKPPDYVETFASLFDPPEVEAADISDYAAPCSIRWPRMRSLVPMSPVRLRR